jgi:putative tricarboxylic transport membrane protein
MNVIDNFTLAFGVALEPINLLVCFIGVTIGTLIGVLPGLGPTASISLLLPVTFTLEPVQAIIMLAGIYYGAYYGGSTTSILINIPGEAASVVTCLDGYQMAKKGRAGPALGIAAMGSFIGATIAVALMFFMAPPLAGLALKFGPPEFVGLTILGLTLVTYLSSGSMVKALLMAAVGILLGTIGMDIVTGRERFTLGIDALSGGISIVPVAMGLFGIAEVLSNIEKSLKRREFFSAKVKNLLPTKKDWRKSAGPIGRGSFLGFLLGIIPGGGGMLASFASYAMEKRIAKDPDKFGEGDIRGVAGPETANNSGAQGSFIPLMTMGIPCNVVMAVLLGALMLHGVTIGPRLIVEEPELFWGVVGSMYVGNAMLLVLNLPLIGLWVRFLKVPYPLLFPLICLFCLIGAYTISNNTYDIYIMIIFGVLGYLFRKFEYEPAPLVLAFVLSPIMENAFRQSLIISGGDWSIFITRPISASFLITAAILLSSPFLLQMVGKLRPGRMVEEKDEY